LCLWNYFIKSTSIILIINPQWINNILNLVLYACEVIPRDDLPLLCSNIPCYFRMLGVWDQTQGLARQIIISKVFINLFMLYLEMQTAFFIFNHIVMTMIIFRKFFLDSFASFISLLLLLIVCMLLPAFHERLLGHMVQQSINTTISITI